MCIQDIRVVERAFDIIEALACSRKSMSVTDIAKLTQISKSTTSRLLQTMHSRGFVEKDSHINALELQTEAKSFLVALRDEFNMANYYPTHIILYTNLLTTRIFHRTKQLSH